MTSSRPGFQTKWMLAGLLALWVLLNCLIFPPNEVWPLAYVCLAPWAVAVCAYRGRKWLYLNAYVWGVVFFFFSFSWLWDVAYIPLGKAGSRQFHLPAGAMTLGMYMGVYFPLMAWAVRHVYWTRRVALVLGLPAVWVAGEFARATVFGGLPWFTLAQSHYQRLTVIQVSDLVGAYGVSFVLASVSGFLGDLVLRRWFGSSVVVHPGVRVSGAYVLVLVTGTLGYGAFRLSQDAMSEGPRIATIQGNYVLDVLPETTPPAPWEKRNRIFEHIARASTEKPDMFVLSESPWAMILNSEYRENPATVALDWQKWSQKCHLEFLQIVQATGAALVTGAMSCELQPTAVDPRPENFNSAFVYKPDRSEPERYDKVHLVLFGEYVPFRGGRLHFLYEWLNGVTPWGQSGHEYSLTAGDGFHVFEMASPSLDGKGFRFGTPICYEDVMPYVSRRFVIGADGEKQADFLVNITNDGWFKHSSELIQHLALAAFRSVENRVGMVRSANTGISAFIKPTGEVYAPVHKNGRLRGDDVEGYSVARVMTDTRVSLYSRWGDWFAISLSVLTGIACVDGFWVRRKRLFSGGRLGRSKSAA